MNSHTRVLCEHVFIYFCNYLEVGLLGYNNYEFFMVLLQAPLSEISIENILYQRERLVLLSLVLQVMGGEGKAWIGQCCSLWGKKARLDVASPDSRVTKSLQQGQQKPEDRFRVRRPKTIEWQYV